MEVLKKGSRGNDVKKLQRLLHLYEDGIFGKLTEEAVKEFQEAHGLVDDGIVGKKTWEALQKGEKGLVKSRRKITEIIVHCTATPEGKDYTIKDITAWHKQRGFSTIGYHYVVYRDGSVHNGRDVNIVGAHCPNHNSKSIGVCYIGGVENRKNPKTGKYDIPKDTRTNVQKASLEILLRKLRTLYPTAKIYGHRDFANRACPSFDAKKEYAKI